MVHSTNTNVEWFLNAFVPLEQVMDSHYIPANFNRGQHRTSWMTRREARWILFWILHYILLLQTQCATFQQMPSGLACKKSLVNLISWTGKKQYKLNQKNVSSSPTTHLSGFARTRWPKVTKLVSWLDINQAKDETLRRSNTTQTGKRHHQGNRNE